MPFLKNSEDAEEALSCWSATRVSLIFWRFCSYPGIATIDYFTSHGLVIASYGGLDVLGVVGTGTPTDGIFEAQQEDLQAQK